VLPSIGLPGSVLEWGGSNAKNMKRILLVANTDWYLYNYRLSLACYLSQQGFEVVLVSPAGEYTHALQAKGLRWVEWRVGRQTLAPWKELRSVLQLVKIYRQEKPTLVHHCTAKAVTYGSLAAMVSRVPGVINNITGLGFVFIRQDAKARAVRQMMQGLYWLAGKHPNYATIFENPADQEYFLSKRMTSPERTWLIEGVGVDVDAFVPLSEPAGVPVVVLPARMLWDKGVGTLVEAGRLLKKKAQARLALVGKPDHGNPGTVDEPTLRRWVEEGAVEWWGWQEDMKSVYSRCHIVTLPSSYGEGVPTSLLEAAACGRPIVASDIPGCREVVAHGENGLLVPPGNAEALAEALAILVHDADLRREMGRAGRQRVLERFSKERINAATLAVYHNVLGVNR
jgi:glycosyltransferase involved in cell wall biosynthesis